MFEEKNIMKWEKRNEEDNEEIGNENLVDELRYRISDVLIKLKRQTTFFKKQIKHVREIMNEMKYVLNYRLKKGKLTDFRLHNIYHNEDYAETILASRDKKKIIKNAFSFFDDFGVSKNDFSYKKLPPDTNLLPDHANNGDFMPTLSLNAQENASLLNVDYSQCIGSTLFSVSTNNFPFYPATHSFAYHPPLALFASSTFPVAGVVVLKNEESKVKEQYKQQKESGTPPEKCKKISFFEVPPDQIKQNHNYLLQDTISRFNSSCSFTDGLSLFRVCPTPEAYFPSKLQQEVRQVIEATSAGMKLIDAVNVAMGHSSCSSNYDAGNLTCNNGSSAKKRNFDANNNSVNLYNNHSNNISYNNCCINKKNYNKHNTNNHDYKKAVLLGYHSSASPNAIKKPLLKKNLLDLDIQDLENNGSNLLNQTISTTATLDLSNKHLLNDSASNLDFRKEENDYYCLPPFFFSMQNLVKEQVTNDKSIFSKDINEKPCFFGFLKNKNETKKKKKQRV